MQDCSLYLGKANLMRKICKRGPQSSEILGKNCNEFIIGSVYFTGNSGYWSSKIVVCGTGNIPQRFPYCESHTTKTENGYATTISQTSVTRIFGEIDTSFIIWANSH